MARAPMIESNAAQPAVGGHTRGIRWRGNIRGGWGILCVPPFLRHHSFLLLFPLSRSQKHCLGSFSLAMNSFIYGLTSHFLRFKHRQDVRRQSTSFGNLWLKRRAGGGHRQAAQAGTVRVAPSSSILKYKRNVL